MFDDLRKAFDSCKEKKHFYKKKYKEITKERGKKKAR